MNVIDSSGWIEYFLDSPRADLFAMAIEDLAKLLVPVVSIFEVHKVLSRKLPAGAVQSCLDVMRQGRVLDLTDRRAVAAADIAVKHKLTMADAVIYSMAREFEGMLWTQDVDYKGLAGVRYFEKPQI
jgi:predicted nucleic acid-binding protein